MQWDPRFAMQLNRQSRGKGKSNWETRDIYEERENNRFTLHGNVIQTGVKLITLGDLRILAKKLFPFQGSMMSRMKINFTEKKDHERH